MQEQEVQQTETKPVPTTEESLVELAKISRMRHKMLSGLTRAHLADFLNTLAFAPRVSGNQKVAMINQLLDAMEGVLDLGLDITNVQVPEKGTTGKRVATLAGIMAQAMDNRFLLLAEGLRQEEMKSTENKTEEVNNG